MGAKYASGGHVIKIDHVSSGAETSAVYLPANKRMQGKQMTAVTGGDHNAPSTDARRRSSSRSTRHFGWQIKGRSHRREEGR